MDFIDGTLVMTDQWNSAVAQAEVIGRCKMARTVLDIDAKQLESNDEE